MRATIIHNPSAGKESISGEELIRIAEEEGFIVQYHSSKKRNLQTVLKDPGDVIIVAGGDGTLEKVVKYIVGTITPIALLPTGSANNIARVLNIRNDIRKRIKAIKSAKRIMMDIGIVQTSKNKFIFLESTGFGLLASLIDVFKRKNKSEVNKLDEPQRCLLEMLENYSPEFYNIIIDEKDFSGYYLMVEIMNIGTAGPNMEFAPKANWSDKMLDVVLLKVEDKEHLQQYISKKLGNKKTTLHLNVVRGKRIRISCSNIPVHIDDFLQKAQTINWELRTTKETIEFLL